MASLNPTTGAITSNGTYDINWEGGPGTLEIAYTSGTGSMVPWFAARQPDGVQDKFVIIDGLTITGDFIRNFNLPKGVLRLVVTSASSLVSNAYWKASQTG